MRYLAITLLGFGVAGLFAFYLGFIKGEIKWEPDKPLTGPKARVAGLVGLVIGLLLLAAGGYVAMRVLGR